MKIYGNKDNKLERIKKKDSEFQDKIQRKEDDKSEKSLTGPIRWIAIIAVIVLAMTTKTNFGNFINFENIGELIEKLPFKITLSELGEIIGWSIVAVIVLNVVKSRYKKFKKKGGK